MTQAEDINSECDISPCTTTFPWYTSLSNPQDVAVSVYGQICTMTCLFKTCKQMLRNTQLLSCCIMFHVSQGKYSPSFHACIHTYSSTHIQYAYSTWTCGVIHALHPIVDYLFMSLLPYLSCGLVIQP